MAPVIRVFGAALQTYPLFILIAAGIGLWIAERTARALALPGSRVHDVGFYGLIATALGARLVYAATHWSAYLEAPLSILSLTTTAMSWPGGAAVGVAVGLLYARRHRLPGPGVLDALAPGALAALAIERVGAFLGARGLGTPSAVPWTVRLMEEARHPVQLYEATILLAAAAILWRRRARRRFEGQMALLAAIAYSAARLALEPLHARTPALWGPVRVVQVVALAVLLGAIGLAYWRHFAGPRPAAPAVEGTQLRMPRPDGETVEEKAAETPEDHGPSGSLPEVDEPPEDAPPA